MEEGELSPIEKEQNQSVQSQGEEKKEEEKKEEATDGSEETVNQIFEAAALPQNSATQFTQAAQPGTAVQSIERELPRNADLLGIKAAHVSPNLFIKLLNEGNILEIVASIMVGGDPRWVAAASAIANISKNASFRIGRCKVLSPLLGVQDIGQRTAAIREAKAAILRTPGVPPGVNPSHLSWDSISFKIPPSAMELFCAKNPQAIQQLDPNQLAILDQVQELCSTTIRDKCTEFRARTGTSADEFVGDQSLYLETQLMGHMDGDRKMRIARVGRGTLINYVEHMQQIFMSGNLPSALQPSKIYACHDVVTAIELRGTIQKLAETQISQIYSTVGNRNVTARAFKLGEGMGENQWSAGQNASIMMKRNVDTYQRKALNAFGVNYEQPMARLENKLVGSSNTLAQQLEARTGDAVVTQTEEQKELANQQLSVLLACLRQRASAVAQSDWELMPEDDLDHMEIVKFLSQQDESAGAGAEELNSLATVLQEAYATGYNVYKFNSINLQPELVQLVNYTMEGRAKQMLKQIPLFDADLREGGSLFAMLMNCIINALAQESRLNHELKDRAAKRQVGNSASAMLF